MYYTYLLKLANNDYYVGSSEDLTKRVKDHKEGKNISTRSFRPVELVYYCAFPKKTQAIKFEMYLKSGLGKAFRNKHLVEKS